MDTAMCISCRRFRYKDDMARIFMTGFTRIDGVDHPLGVCKECEAQPSGQEQVRRPDLWNGSERGRDLWRARE